MKLYKSLFIATALLGGMMSSCSEDGVWNQASQSNLWLTEGTAYTFDNSTINYTYYPADVMKDMDVKVTVTRGTTQGTVEIPIASVFSDDELISGPSSVTFQDGSNTAEYPIHVKQEFEPGVSATAKLVIDTLSVGIPAVPKPKKLEPGATHEDSVKFLADSTAYAVYVGKLSLYKLATTVTVEKDFNWKSLGIGKYYDRFTWGSTYYEAEIQQAVEDNSWYRVVDPYTQALEDNEITVKDGPSKYVKVKLLKPGDVIRGTTVTKKDLVYFPDFRTGEYSENYGAEINAFHPSKFTSLSDESNWTYSTVAAYQKDGTPAQILLAPYYYMMGVGGWNYTQQTGTISIVFPGVKIYNYSAKIEYAGLFTNPSNVVFALANYELSGADAKKAEAYKVAVISQDDDAEAVADAILAGEYPAADLEDVIKDERIQIEIPEGLTGKLQIILVIIDEKEESTDLEVKNVVAAPFEYYAGGEPWQSIGIGIYTDDFIVPSYTQAGASFTYKVEIEEHTQTPGLYRIKNAYATVAKAFGKTGGEKDIEIHAEEPNFVYFLEQPTGLDLGYGEISIVSYAGRYIAANGLDVIKSQRPQWFGTVVDGVITLPSIEAQTQSGVVGIQGWIHDDGYYVAGTNGEFKLVLPTASAAAKEKAKRAAAANEFERRLKAVSLKKASKDNMRSIKLFQNLRL